MKSLLQCSCYLMVQKRHRANIVYFLAAAMQSLFGILISEVKIRKNQL